MHEPIWWYVTERERERVNESTFITESVPFETPLGESVQSIADIRHWLPVYLRRDHDDYNYFDDSLILTFLSQANSSHQTDSQSLVLLHRDIPFLSQRVIGQHLQFVRREKDFLKCFFDLVDAMKEKFTIQVDN